MILSNWCSVTVTYNPDLTTDVLKNQMNYLINNVSRVIVVDNGSSNQKKIGSILFNISHEIIFLPQPRNMGIGYALNRGFNYFLNDPACDYIITLDQDTEFLFNTIPTAKMEIDKIKNKEQFGIFGLNYTTLRFSKPIKKNPHRQFNEVRTVITSGSIISRYVFENIRFDSKLFLYFVDDDFCHRVRMYGKKIAILNRAIMIHREGERIEKNGKIYFHIEPARLYYITRNGIVLLKRYKYIKPIIYLLLVIAMNFISTNHFIKMINPVLMGFKDSLNMQ